MSENELPTQHHRLMETASHPPFLDELADAWGEQWGASDETGILQRVLVRKPGDEFDAIDRDAWNEEAGALVDPDGRWYWTSRNPPDIDLVHEQHAGLVRALEAEGVRVDCLASLGASYPKAMYIRDPLITVPGGAIIGRMGVRMRRGEEPRVTRAIAELGMPILGTIAGSGTLEGGSFIKLRPDLAVLGTSIRCNAEAADQLRALLGAMGIELLVVSVPGYSIHLDLHMAMVDSGRALVDAEHLPYDFLLELKRRGVEPIDAHPGEAWGLNLLCLRPRRVLMAEGSPRTGERLAEAGVEVLTIPYDEIQKNGGGVHCSTMELVRCPAG